MGWQYDKDGPKADVFSPHVAALGVTFSLASSRNGIVTVGNTEKRILEVCQMINSILERKTLSLKEAQVARGRLAFCDAFVFGKAGKSALQEITAHAYARPAQKLISSRLTQALLKLKSRLQESPPRTMSCSLTETVYIFSDASLDDNWNGGFGAVIFDERGFVLAWMSHMFGRRDVLPFAPEGAVTVIGELETVAVCMAIHMWIDILESKHAVFFIDNEGAKFSFVKGYSHSAGITLLCDFAADLLDKHTVVPWYSRVPSPSNIADFPSRKVDHALLLPSKCVSSDLVMQSFSAVASCVKAHLLRR